MWPKAFHQALLLFQKNPKKTKQFLKDKRITQQEKKILHAFYLLRDNLNEEVLSLKNSISAPTLYVEIQMNVLLGMASNNLSHFSDAVEYFTKARQLVLQDDSCPVIKFEILLKCFFVYSNLNAVVQMKPLFDEMLLVDAKSQDMKIKILHASFVYYDQADEAEKAREALFELECYYPGMNERSAMAHLLTRFMFYVKIEDFDECRKVLNRHGTFHPMPK